MSLYALRQAAGLMATTGRLSIVQDVHPAPPIVKAPATVATPASSPPPTIVV